MRSIPATNQTAADLRSCILMMPGLKNLPMAHKPLPIHFRRLRDFPLEHQYIIHPDSYLVDWNLSSTGTGQLFSQNNLNLDWHSEMKKTQTYVYYEKRLTNVCFSTDNEFDYISSKTEKTFEKPVQWVSVVQQFFNRTLIAKNNFDRRRYSMAPGSFRYFLYAGNC